MITININIKIYIIIIIIINPHPRARRGPPPVSFTSPKQIARKENGAVHI